VTVTKPKTILSGRELPILFCAEMIQAVRDLRKTQTRRVVDVAHVLTPAQRKARWEQCPDPALFRHDLMVKGCPRLHVPIRHPADHRIPWPDCGCWTLHPRYAVGDRLWAKTGLFMPKKDADLWLLVEDVRIQRVQNISEADALAEGMTPYLCATVLNKAAGRLDWHEACSIEDEDGGDPGGWYCRCCAGKMSRQFGKEDGKKYHVIGSEGCSPETDGPAYCDECQRPLLMSLTEYGIERELFLEGFTKDEKPECPEHYAASGLDAKIAALIASGIGALEEKHWGRLAQIGFATLWNSLNAKRGFPWSNNDWVWVYTFSVEEEI
jgi:hypothetical protein